MFRAIIFDMDGLMIDTEPFYWEIARKIAGENGSGVTDATLRKMMGRSRTESMQIFIDDCKLDRDVESLLAEREVLMAERFAAGVDPMPGLREILARFQDQLTYAVATSSPEKFTRVLLPGLEIENYFKVIQTGDGVVNGKPDSEIYLKAIARLQILAAECIVLEDTHAGALSGHRAGAYTIAVPTHLTETQDFSFADARTKNLFEAADHIAALIRR